MAGKLEFDLPTLVDTAFRDGIRCDGRGHRMDAAIHAGAP
jgi:hypothetical protein